MNTLANSLATWIRFKTVAAMVAAMLSGDEVKLHQSAGGGVGVGTPLILRWDVEEFDPLGMHDASKPECITIVTAGTYQVGATVQWSLHERGSRDLMLWKRPPVGYAKMLERDLTPPAQDIVTTHTAHAFVELVPGDCVYVQVTHTASVGINVLGTSFWVKQ